MGCTTSLQEGDFGGVLVVAFRRVEVEGLGFRVAQTPERLQDMLSSVHLVFFCRSGREQEAAGWRQGRLHVPLSQQGSCLACGSSELDLES